jgi:murein DD-endopeptidase MepM/ murein hydrolase activator NlpD
MAAYLGRPAVTREERVARLRSAAKRSPRGEKRENAPTIGLHRGGAQRTGASATGKQAPFGLYNPITMQQRKEIEQAQRTSRARGRWVLAAAVLVSAVVLAEPLVSAGYRVYTAVVRDQYELYRVRAEQSMLHAANARMRSELIALRSKRTKQNEGRESALAQKITELESLIESVTSLGVFRDRAHRSAQARASKAQRAGEGRSALAAILNSPQLAGTSTKVSSTKDGAIRDRAIKDRTFKDSANYESQAGRDEGVSGAGVSGAGVSGAGVGGAEEPCDGHDADEGSHGAALAGAHDANEELCEIHQQESLNAAQQALVKRINRFISVLQFLPLGTPVQGALTSGFGHRRSPFSFRTSFHYGVDISLKAGSHIMATGAGKVVKVEHDRTYGIMVDVQHAPNLVTRYAHLSKALVKEGQKVQRGMVIALSGNTGRSTGPHLHYEVRHNGQPRNPAPFVQLAGRLSEFVNLDGQIG